MDSMTPIKRRAAWLALAALLAGAAAGAHAQAWPSRPVTVIVPFPAGGGTDAFARPLTAQLTKNTGRQFIIDNKGGAGGTLGAGIAARAAADGYTLFMGAVHHTIAPSMYPKLDYNIETDFIPLALVASVPQVIVVHPQRVPVSDYKAFVEHLQKNPGKLNFGSAGNGTSHHLAGELFKGLTKTSITHVPYRGAGPAMQDLLSGQIDMMFDGMGTSAPQIRTGRLKALAVAADRRAPGFPDVPTTAEVGLPDYKVATWYGLWAPKGTPQDAIERIQAELRKALASEEIKTAWAALAAEPPSLYGADFGKFVGSEVRRWTEVVKASGAKLE